MGVAPFVDRQSVRFGFRDRNSFRVQTFQPGIPSYKAIHTQANSRIRGSESICESHDSNRDFPPGFGTIRCYSESKEGMFQRVFLVAICRFWVSWWVILSRNWGCVIVTLHHKNSSVDGREGSKIQSLDEWNESIQPNVEKNWRLRHLFRRCTLSHLTNASFVTRVEQDCCVESVIGKEPSMDIRFVCTYDWLREIE